MTLDPLQLMQRVADEALALIDAADGALVSVLIDERTLCHACASGFMTQYVGRTLQVRGSLSGEVLEQRATLICDDTLTDARVNREAAATYEVRSSVCVPLTRADVPLGVLSVSSRRARAFGERDVAILSELVAFMSAAVGAASDFTSATARLVADSQADSARAGRFVANVLDPAGARANATRSDIERALQARAFSLAFQPIFALASGDVVAVEALARFEEGQAPDVVIARAHEVGLGVELEVALVELALAHLRELPSGVSLALNAGPAALASGGVSRALGDIDPRRVIVELTEQLQVDDYPHLIDVLQGLRGSGVRVAVDDAGAGFASMMHVVKLAPDFIKLDRELVSGIDIDPVRRALVSTLTRFGEETGAAIVAEGVEHAPELVALKRLGIGLVQGFFLARPAPLRSLRGALERGSARVRGAGAEAAAVPTLKP
jgi:EAL domain-containing protein (putative c-di-GMP-specific phosphodiesterase class I)